MLFRLSCASFWLAAALAALALLAPRGRETLLTALSMAACVVAFGLWRAGASAQRQSHALVSAVPEPAMLDELALRDAATTLVHEADAADSLESALHAVARVLRGELGARQAMVFEVRETDATHAMLSDLIESQPGFQAVPRRVRLDARPLGRAIHTQLEAGMPPGAVAVPVIGAAHVAAVIELSGIDVPIEPQALTDLLVLARVTLSARARLAADHPSNHPEFVKPEATTPLLELPPRRAASASGMLGTLNAPARTQSEPKQGVLGDTQRLHEPGFDDHVFKPLDPGQMLAVLSQHPRPHAPAETQTSAGQAAAPVLDPAALARLTELDPKGENQLLERVLKAFQTSVARLRPQADAARLSGDHASLRLVAHTLKSSSASIGALHLSQLCAQIETTIRTAGGDDLGDQLDALNAALDGVLHAIARLLEERA